MERKPYTFDELAELVGAALPLIQRATNDIESLHIHARPIPQLSLDESRAFLCSMIDQAVERGVFTADESFFFGQLLNQYTQAVQAAVLGNTTGRYYVIDENAMIALIDPRQK